MARVKTPARYSLKRSKAIKLKKLKKLKELKSFLFDFLILFDFSTSYLSSAHANDPPVKEVEEVEEA